VIPKYPSAAKEVKNQAKQTLNQAIANPWIERLARFGYAAKGVLYITIGILATQVALGLVVCQTQVDG